MSMTRNSDPHNGRVVARNASTFINPVRCSSEHLIIATKRGSVAKAPNVDAQEKPTLRFKGLSSIYECGDANKMHTDLTFSWQTDKSGGSSGDCQVKLELASTEEADYLGKSNNSLALDDGESIFRKNNADMENDQDGDELSGMTLKEFKNRCKKHKVIKSDVPGEAYSRSCRHVFSCTKSENAAVELVEVESDLEEPLIFLKKQLKKFKPERKRKKCKDLSSSHSVVSTQEQNEQRQYSHAAQHFISIDGRSPEQAISMDGTLDFHLKNIKEEHDSQTAVAADEFSAFSFIPAESFPDCTITQVSDEAQRNETETSESESRRSNILDYSIDDILCSENYQLDLGMNENATKTCRYASSSLQEQGSCSISSPEMTCSVKKEILEADSLNDGVNIGHCFAYDNAECHFLGQPLDEAPDWSNRYEMGNTEPYSSAKKSHCSSIDEVPIEYPLFNNQISLQESIGKNFDVIESSFSPLICSSDPVPADHGSELSDSSKSTIRIKEIMLETFDPMTEQNNNAACCTQEICSKASNSIDANASNEERKDDDNSTYKVLSQNIEMDSSSIDCAKTNVSSNVSGIESEISVNFGNKELAGDMPTDIFGGVHSLQPTEHSNSKTYAACISEDPNLLSSSTNCLNSIDATEEKAMATVEEKLYSLKVHEESTCSNGFLHPVGVQGLEGEEGQNCLSQNCDQLSSVDESLLIDNSPKKNDEIPTHLTRMFSDEGSNQSPEASSCHDVDGLEDDEAPRYTSEHPPIKLMSNRKALSPTSQTKLCQAVDAESDKVSKSGKKLLFEKRTNNSSPPESGHMFFERLSSPERINFSGTGKRLLFEKNVNCNTSESDHGIRELMLSPERANKKPKNGSVLPTTKGILKSPLPSMKPCSCMDSSLIRRHTQEAVTFSQRQMHDIESLAMKLVKGLVSMKSIVAAALNSEHCSSEPSTFNTDEMRIAIDNASELEDTTKRWLSMMGRDCNRFCKILRSTVYKTAAPTDVHRKDRKKIIFADEAGGTLCHIRVFEGQPSSSVDSEHQEADPCPQTLVKQVGN